MNKYEAPLPHLPNEELTSAYILLISSFLLIFSHYWQASPSGFGLDLPIMNIGWLFFSLLIAIGLLQIQTTQHLHYNKLTVAILTTITALLVPILYLNSGPIDFYIGRILGLVGLGLLFFSFQQLKLSDNSIALIMTTFCLSAFIEGCIGLTQFISAYINNESLYRVNIGTGRQPNVQATLMITAWAFLNCLILSLHFNNFKYYKLIEKSLYILLPVYIFNVVFSSSGSGFVVFIFINISITPLLFTQNKKQRLLTLKILAISLLSFTLANQFLEQVQPNSPQTKGITDENGRIQLYQESLDLITQKPLLGHGYGNFPSIYLENYAKRVQAQEQSYSKAIEGNVSHPHNELLFWFIEGGLITILAMLTLTAFIILMSLTSKRPNKILFLALVFPVALHSMLELPLYNSPLHIFALTFGLYLISRYAMNDSCKRKLINKSLIEPLKLVASLLILVSTLFFLSNLHTIYKIHQFHTSTPTSTRYLSEVLNPIAWKNRLDFYTYSAHVKFGVDNKSPKHCTTYIKWAEQHTKVFHYKRYYDYLYFAYQCIGDIQKQKSTLEKAIYLYPSENEFKVMYRKLLKESTDISNKS